MSPLARCGSSSSGLDLVYTEQGTAAVTAMAFVSGELIVARADGSVTALDTDTFTPTATGGVLARSGRVVTVLGRTDDVLVVGDDGGAVRTFLEGVALGSEVVLVPAASRFVAASPDGRFAVAGTSGFRGELHVLDTTTTTVAGAETTDLWTAQATWVDATGMWLTVGEWYGCLAIDRRDARGPAAASDAWDGCRFGSDPMLAGTLRALTRSADDDTLHVVGTGFVGTFDAADLARGPRRATQTNADHHVVVHLASDGLLAAAGRYGDDGVVELFDAADLTLRRRHLVPAATRLDLDSTTGLVASADAAGSLTVHRCTTP